MPVEACTKDGEAGFRWGSSGACFKGEDARAKAAAVGRAIAAQDAEKAVALKGGHEWNDISLAEIEERVRKGGDSLLIAILGLPTEIEEVEEVWTQEGAVSISPVRESVDLDISARVTKFEGDGTEQQLVWAEVYAPDLPDAHGDLMTRKEVQKLAHRFLKKAMTGAVDVQHDNDPTRALTIVESFVAGEDCTEFIPHSWVVCCHVEDDLIWADIKSGKLNGFSMQAKVFLQDREIEFEIPAEGLQGTTAEGADSSQELHTHGFTVRLASDGEFLGGETTVAKGHTHPIISGSVTEGSVSEGATDPVPNSHTHRFNFMELITPTG